LIKGLRAAHARIADSTGCSIGELNTLTLDASPKSPYHRNLCRIAFLAPDLQRLILEGRQPLDLTLTRMLQNDLPGSWVEQRRLFKTAA